MHGIECCAESCIISDVDRLAHCGGGVFDRSCRAILMI